MISKNDIVQLIDLVKNAALSGYQFYQDTEAVILYAGDMVLRRLPKRS